MAEHRNTAWGGGGGDGSETQVPSQTAIAKPVAPATNDVLVWDGAAWVSGKVATANVHASAAITDAQLASPANPAYKNIQILSYVVSASLAANTFYMDSAGTLRVNSALTGNAPVVFHLIAADYAVAGKTSKLSMRASCIVNGFGPAMTLTTGLYPVTAITSGSNVMGVTLGTVVAGSTVAFASPSASSINVGVSGDFNFPSDGLYAIGLVTSGTSASQSATAINSYLRYRNT